MTLDLYGHLFGDRLDEVANRPHHAARTALAAVYPSCTEADVVDAPKTRSTTKPPA